MSSRNRNENPLRQVYIDGLSANIWKGKHAYLRPSIQPGFLNLGVAGGVPAFPTAAAGQTDTAYCENGVVLELFQTLAQTVMPTIHATKGLNIAGDQTDNDALEIVVGNNSTVSPNAVLLGTDANCFFRVTLELTDVSGSDEVVVGWRKQQTYSQSAAFDGTTDPVYTDFAAIGIVGSSDGSIHTVTDLNDSGVPVKTDTAFDWADTKIHTLEVRVVGRRVKYYINDKILGSTISKDALGVAITAQPTVSGAAFTFDTADTIIPFIFLRQRGADLNEGIYIRDLEAGFLSEIGLSNSERGEFVS